MKPGRLAEAADPRTALAKALSSEYTPEPPDTEPRKQTGPVPDSAPVSALDSLKLGYELGKLAFQMRMPKSSPRGGLLGLLESVSRPMTYEAKPMVDATHHFEQGGVPIPGTHTTGMVPVPESGPAHLNTGTGKLERQYDPKYQDWAAAAKDVHTSEPAGIGGAIIPAMTALQVAPRVGQTWSNMSEALHGRRFRSALTERRQGLEP